MEEQGGGPQEMAFVGAAPGWFRSKTAAGQGQGRPPLQKPPLGKRDPPLRYQVGFTGSLGCCPRNGSPPFHPEDRVFSRGPPLAASPLGPQRQSARGSPGDLGPGPGPAKVPGQVERALAGGTLAHGPVLPWGLRPVPSSGRSESSFGSNCPTLPPRGKLGPAASTL